MCIPILTPYETNLGVKRSESHKFGVFWGGLGCFHCLHRAVVMAMRFTNVTLLAPCRMFLPSPYPYIAMFAYVP